ncbi:MAG: hypothetical protein WDW38_000559 [Sanguina aurantia]
MSPVTPVVHACDDMEQGKTYQRSGTFGLAGMRVTVKDVSYSVPDSTPGKKGDQLYLLKAVNGFFEPGQMAALMGPSGSGKTTLLDVLAGRKNAGKLEGSVLFAGQKASTAFLRRYTGYVEQFDTLLGILSVEEMLMYTAELKRSMSEPLSSKKAAVDELMKKLALEVCRNVKIGSSMAKGISGGQAKRVNIGIALITNPRVLFLDEPTSGLDSYTSNEVMSVVKSLVKDGTTICATIHSPTSFCFSLFDKLMMMVRGRIVYFGKQGHSAIEFALAVAGDTKEYSPGYNDAEYLVDLITEADHMGRGHVFADHYDQSQLRRDNDAVVDLYLGEAQPLPETLMKELAVTQETCTPWWWGFKTLVKYRTVKNYQDPAFLGPRIGDKVLISLLIMTLYLNVGKDLSNGNIVNISAVLYMWVTLPAFGAAAYIPSLVLERSLFVRERADGLYYVITYLFAKMFDELLVAACSSLVVATWTFYGVKLQGEWILFWLVYYLTLCNGIVLAYFVAAFSPNMDVANAVLPTYVVTLLFFGGFLFRFSAMPQYWKWYSYVDFLRYSWGAVMVNQFDNSAPRDPLWLGDETVLEAYSLKDINKWTYVGYLSLFVFTFFMMAWGTMSYKKYSSR